MYNNMRTVNKELVETYFKGEIHLLTIKSLPFS